MSHVHVPATYLKHFSQDSARGRRSIVYCYNKKSKKYQHIPVNRIGVQNKFFPPDMEQYLNIYERHYDRIIESIRNDDYSKKINGFRFEMVILSVLSNFLARSTSFLNHFNNVWANHKLDNPTEFSEVRDWFIENGIKTFLTKGIKNYGIIESEIPVITSDNPLVHIPHRYGNLNIIPISFSEFIIFSNSIDAETANKMGKNMWKIAHSLNINHLNRKIIYQADTFVILPNQNYRINLKEGK